MLIALHRNGFSILQRLIRLEVGSFGTLQNHLVCVCVFFCKQEKKETLHRHQSVVEMKGSDLCEEEKEAFEISNDYLHDRECSHVPNRTQKALGPNHIKLLYLISKYSGASNEKQKWIKHISLLVLIYEGIVNRVFTYDYAPSPQLMRNRHIFMNISQEGKSDIDDLREEGLIHGLKLSSRRYQTVTAYQISAKGEKVLDELLTVEYRESVNQLYNCESGNDYSNLLMVEWSGSDFILVNPVSGYREHSTITDCEEVSFVSSPYLPLNLQRSASSLNALTCNADRVKTAINGQTDIREELHEIIHLSNCTMIIGEWIPFGSNQVAALNSKLGSSERVKGGLFTSIIDEYPEDLQLEVGNNLTKVKILDFDHCEYINFEAEVRAPEKDGIVQVENFGMHCREDGFICCGLFLESVMDRKKEKISLDMLSRVAVHINQDSSKILDSLISIYQRSLLDTMFTGDSLNRNKFTILIAEEILPMLKAEQYMDKGCNENEIKQVVGDTQAAYSLSDNMVLIIGKHGLILAGPDSKRYEQPLLQFLSLNSREIFIENFFYRVFSLHNDLRKMTTMIHNHDKDPNSIPNIRKALSDLTKTSILLSETLSFLRESIDHMEQVTVDTNDKIFVNICEIFNLRKRKASFLRRVKDLEKNVLGISHELRTLRDMTDVISETQMFKLQEALQSNTKNLEQVFRTNERASSSLEVLQIILAGTLAFDVLDRVTGGWSVVDSTEWGREWIQKPLINMPGVWFLINISLWAIIGFILVRTMNYLSEASSGVIQLRMKINQRINVNNLYKYLSSKKIKEEYLDIDSTGTRIKKITWQEEDVNKWLGCPPIVDITFDIAHSFLLAVFLEIDKKSGRLREVELEKLFLEELKEQGVIIIEENQKSSSPTLVDKY